MRRLLKRLLFIVPTVSICISLGAYFYWATTCACEKDPAEHLAPLNPFRDRAPEREAEALFQGLSAGKCLDESFCGKAVKRGRVKDWTLSARKIEGDRVLLGYHIDYDNSRKVLASVLVDVRRIGTSWKVAEYSENY